MTYIKTIPYTEADGRLLKLYDRVKGPNNNVDNIMMAHSLRPHSMEGHMALYKNVLHHNSNTVPKWFLEAIGVYVSLLNKCAYCVEHHYTGLVRLLNDDDKANSLLTAFQAHDLKNAPLTDAEKAALHYAQKLTTAPQSITSKDINNLRETGYSDGEILEINQVTSYFSYANRTVLGLGISTDGDILGLSPNNSDNPKDWSHT